MCSSTSPAKAALNSSMLVDVVLASAASEVMAVDGSEVLQKRAKCQIPQMAAALVVKLGTESMVRAGLGMCEIDLGTMNAAIGCCAKT